VAQYMNKLDFFQKKLDYIYDDVDEKPIQAYEYIARVK